MAGTAASAAELRPIGWAVPVAGIAFGLVLLAVLVADLAAPLRLALLAALSLATVGMARELGRARQGRRLAWDGRGGWTGARSRLIRSSRNRLPLSQRAQPPNVTVPTLVLEIDWLIRLAPGSPWPVAIRCNDREPE